MKKPIIGIVPLVDNEKDSLWMLPGYMNGIEQADGIPIMFPLTTNTSNIKQLFNNVDGILFTGGQDVYPMLYHKTPSPECGEYCLERDLMENQLLKLVLQQNKPALGICRGLQFINAALGGDLYQDLPTERKSNVEHHQSAPYSIPVHKAILVKGSPLEQLLRQNVIDVNSYHHQAIKTLSPLLDAMVFSEDGIVEAVYHKTSKFLWAVQWHPEFSFVTDSHSRKIFEEFVRNCQ